MDKLKLSSLNDHLKNIGWSVFNTYGTSIVSFIFVLILTRLIAPETFGLVAKFISIILVINVIVEAGKTTDLSRKKHLKNDNLDRAMVWIFIRGIISLILFNLIMTLLFSNQLKLLECFFLSLLLISSCMQSIPVMLIIREKRFKIKAMISMFCTIISGIISVCLALTGLEFYALIIGQLVNGILLVALSYKYSNYCFSFKKPVFDNFSLFTKDKSKFIMLSNLTERSIQAVIYNIIGKTYGLESLGYITRAETLRNATSTALSKAVNRVSYSHNVQVFNKTNKKPFRSHLFFLLTFSMLSLPLILIFSLFSEIIILFLFGKNWILVSNYLSPVLCLGYTLSILSFNNSFLVSIGVSVAPFLFNLITLVFIGIVYCFINFINLNDFFWILVLTSSFVILLSNSFLFFIKNKKPSN